MRGLLIKLLSGQCGTETSFARLFGPVLKELDRLYWLFENYPWMGPPSHWNDDDVAWCCDDSSVQLWRPHALGRYAEHIGEEHILAFGFAPEDARRAEEIAQRHARSSGLIEDAIDEADVALIYTDSTCWEIYTRDDGLLERVRAGLSPSAHQSFVADSGNREDAYSRAGLAEVWHGL